MNKQLPFKENILIVDDKPETLSVLTEILIEHGYNIRTALNVDIALKSACQYTPDLVLMDVRMPGTDGFEACKMLKRIKQLQHVPVIFLTGATDINAKIAAFQSGGVDYITKPFANEEVLARIKTHLIIKQERERYQALAEATTEGILIHDNGVIVDINPAFETMMHCGKDIISKNIKTVLSTKSLKALSQLPKKNKEYCIINEQLFDGIVVMAEAKTKSILYQGQQIQMIALRDITDNIRLERENVSLMSSVSNNHRLGDMVGKSKVMKRIYKKIIQLAASDEPVLISGEGGTGKKLAAHNIHLMSSRAKKACVLVNCSTLSDSLFEIAFFGYQKGAFKRAISNNAGFFEKANKGILLLDKIDTLSINMQDKLLHVIETGEYRPLGGNIKHARFRIISTTNKNLKHMVDQGKMLPDFFHFLNVLSLIKPPLRDRKEDIPTLVKFFVENNQSLNPNKGIITDCIMDKLIEYNWPGNVAELFNELKQYLTGKLDKKSANILPHKSVSISNLFFDLNENITLADAVAHFEQCYIQQVLDMNNGRKNKTSEILGVDPRTLYNKMNRKETS